MPAPTWISRATGIALLLQVVSLVFSLPASAADLGVPALSPPLPERDYFRIENVLNAEVRLEQNPDVIIEPQLGLGHARREREVRTGYDDVAHTIHARAGGRIQLFRTISLSASAKVPVYTVESSAKWIAGSSSSSGATRYDYAILHPVQTLSWAGEMGIHLGGRVDLNLFYDRTRLDIYPAAGESAQENRFGTRLIFRFR